VIVHLIVGSFFDVEVDGGGSGGFGSAVIFSSSSVGCWNWAWRNGGKRLRETGGKGRTPILEFS